MKGLGKTRAFVSSFCIFVLVFTNLFASYGNGQNEELNLIIHEVSEDENSISKAEHEIGEKEFIEDSLKEEKIVVSSEDKFENLKRMLEEANQEDEILLEAGEYLFTEKLVISKNIKLKAKEDVIFKRASSYNKTMVEVLENASLNLISENESIVFDGEKKDTRISDNSGSFIVNKGRLIIDGAKFINDFDNKNNMLIAPIYLDGENSYTEFNSGEISKTDYKSDYGANNWYSAGAFFVRNGARLVMNGGVIKNNLVSYFPHSSWTGKWVNNHSAGAIIVDKGASFIMNAGEITNNESYAGAILVGTTNIYDLDRDEKNPEKLRNLPLSKFEMNGGIISSNIGIYSAGGVLVYGNGEAIMNAGIISKNRGYAGGGILAMDSYVEGGSSEPQTRAKVDIKEWEKRFPARFIMNGGDIIENFALTCGGGVNASSNNVRLYAGNISNNISNDQGGGIYVTASPYVLHIENAFIDGNEATRNFRDTAVYYDNNAYTLHSRTGGGVWLCPTGDAVFYAEDGVTFGVNTATVAGDDLYIEERASGNFRVNLASRNHQASRVKWYLDDENQRYEKENAVELTEIKDITTKKALKAISDEKSILFAKKYSLLRIMNNSSSKGGGIGSNGSVVFGRKPEEENPLKKIEVIKNWGENVEEEAIDVELRIRVDEEDDYLVESFNLNKENNFSYTLKDLPAKVREQNIEDLLYVKEITNKPYVLKVGELEKLDGKHILSFSILRREFSVKGGNIHASYEEKADEDGSFKIGINLLVNDKVYKDEMSYDGNTYVWKGKVNFDEIELDNKNLILKFYKKDDGTVFSDEEDEYTFKLIKKDDSYELLVPQLLESDEGKDPKKGIFEIENVNISGSEEIIYRLSLTNEKVKDETINIKVDKLWENVSEEEKREIKVYLVKNGNKTNEFISLNKENNFTGEFRNLSLSENGALIEYGVIEEELSGFKFVTTGSPKDGFILINKKITPPPSVTPPPSITPPRRDPNPPIKENDPPKDEEEPPAPSNKVPKTDDNKYLSFYYLIFVLGLTTLVVCKKKMLS